MPRRPRVFVEGGIYHVYNRFARGAELFANPEEAIESGGKRNPPIPRDMSFSRGAM